MQNKLNYKNIRKIGLVARDNSNLLSEILHLKTLLEKRKILLCLEEKCAKEINLKGFELDELFKSSDFIISLGGDGTLISLCRKAFEHNKAILGINAGKLGFLTDFKIKDAEFFFEDFFQGKFKIENPFLLELDLEYSNGKILKKFAFNDVVFIRNKSFVMSHIQAFRDDKLFNEYYGDGLIVASPAGSTAYNLSASGPIVYALAEVFVLTPICSHSLTQRPIVLPREFKLKLLAKDCVLCIDGQENFEANEFKSIQIGLSTKSVCLIHAQNRDYFQILKEKLNWGK